jgi:FAD/FMN-containing dehydrogenase
VVKISGVQTGLEAVLDAAQRHGAHMVGRAGLGLSWLRLEDRGPDEMAGSVLELRRALEPAACMVLDAPPEVRGQLEPWSPLGPGARELARRVKERFDPEEVCNPGVYPGGI